MLTDIRNTKASCFLENINDVSPGPVPLYLRLKFGRQLCLEKDSRSRGKKKNPKKLDSGIIFTIAGKKSFFRKAPFYVLVVP